jgi:hypothetical protein
MDDTWSRTWSLNQDARYCEVDCFLQCRLQAKIVNSSETWYKLSFCVSEQNGFFGVQFPSFPLSM